MPQKKRNVYDPKHCVTTINDTYCISGYGTAMITGTRDNPLGSVTEGVQGDAVINMSAKNLGTLTITLLATSPSNGELMRLARERETFSIWSANSTLGERMGGEQAFIENFPSLDNNETVGDRVYTIKVLDFTVERTD